MRAKIITFLSILCVALLILAAGCYDPGGPVPEEKHPGAEQAWTSEDVDALVLMEGEAIHSPAPTDNGSPPAECDYIHFLRFRLKGSSGDPCDADAVLVLIPGFLGGANSMHNLGRQVVYMAKTLRDTDLEIWLVDRRPNNLEDLTGVNAAEEAHDTQVATDYYYNGTEIDGGTFQGFLESEDMPFLSEFGLELAMEDVYTIITTMVPDPEVRREKVFVGGHSLGGPLTTLFAGWDFDGDPETLEDAGYMNCAGLVGLDTILMSAIDTSGLSLSQLFGAPADMDAEGYVEVVEQLRDGSISRVVPVPLIYPEYLAMVESLAMEAAWNPDEESTLIGNIPLSEDVDFAMKMLHSRSLDHFLVHIPDVSDFRFTNEAQLGILVDENFQPISALQASAGFLHGGAVVEKDFPLPQDIAQIPEVSELLSSVINMEGQFIANDAGPSYFQLGSGPLYTWANFDEVGDGLDPDYQDSEGALTYTTTADEVSDIGDVARLLYNGPTNALEWYFAMRLSVDMDAAASDYGPEVGLPFLHEESIDILPQIEFVAEKGPIVNMLDELPADIVLVEGHNHLDVCTEAVNRPSHRESDVFLPLIDFVLENI
jgi:pimeloyl-ACP methyl ester carboxylesterase